MNLPERADGKCPVFHQCPKRLIPWKGLMRRAANPGQHGQRSLGKEPNLPVAPVRSFSCLEALENNWLSWWAYYLLGHTNFFFARQNLPKQLLCRVFPRREMELVLQSSFTFPEAFLQLLSINSVHGIECRWSLALGVSCLWKKSWGIDGTDGN